MSSAASNIDAYWMPFTANRDFKANRVSSRAHPATTTPRLTARNCTICFPASGLQVLGIAIEKSWRRYKSKSQNSTTA